MPLGANGEDAGQLYDRLAGELFRYALMILADAGDAEDVVHDVFAAVIRRRTDKVQEIDGYLRRAVRNGAYERLRLRRREHVGDREDAALFQQAAVDDRPDERLFLDRLLRSLPAEQREVVCLKVYEGLTFQQIADLSGESINTVGSRYRYAMDKLQTSIRGGD